MPLLGSSDMRDAVTSTIRKYWFIICPSVINPYFATLIQGMEQEATQRGIDTMLFTTYWDTEKEQRVCEFAKDPMVAGVVFAMIPQQPELARKTE